MCAFLSSHKAEVAPLFGTGPVSLLDNGDDEHFEPDIEQKGVRTYGSIDTFTNDDNDNHADPSVVTAVSSASSKQSKKMGKIVITESGKPETPQQRFLLAAFYSIESFGVITSLTLMATQIMPIVLIPLDQIGVMSLCLKVYVSMFCVLFILVEWDVPIGFLRDASFLQTYGSRGFLYSFLGLSCLEEAYSERVKDMVAHTRDQFHVSWYSLFMQVSSWMMLGLGLAYMLLGMCCLKRVRDKVVQDHRDRWEAYREAMKIYRAENP
jgi:hypothetical protein